MMKLGFLVIAILLLSIAPRLAHAQTPSALDMQITAVVPAGAGTSVRVEVLDPATLMTRECVRVQSSELGSTAKSRVRLTVPKSCVTAASGNLRVCWGEADCAPVAFEEGKSVDLGELSSEFFMPEAPAVGMGPAGADARSNSVLALSLHTASLAAAAAGIALMVSAGALIWRSRRRLA